MKKIAINGRFLARRQTGQERFALETVYELDKIVNKGEFELVVPYEYKGNITLTNIEIVYYGKHKSHLWEQLDFCKYVRKNKLLSMNLCTIQPLFAPGIVCIHDISYKVNPHYFKTRYGRMSALWHKLHYNVAAKFSPVILTVTETSKKEISEVYKIPHDKITVVCNGWEHILRIEDNVDFNIRFPEMRDGEYFISIGSLAPNKNMEWVLDNAKCNQDKQYVIVGKAMLNEHGTDYNSSKQNNVILTGYVSDEELISLLKHCKALIFPSFYEGFGIPPLEALALGKEAIVANASCMPEIFGESVHYIDPYNSSVDLDVILESKVELKDQVLDKYRYFNTAKKIYDLLKNNNY